MVVGEMENVPEDSFVVCMCWRLTRNTEDGKRGYWIYIVFILLLILSFAIFV